MKKILSILLFMIGFATIAYAQPQPAGLCVEPCGSGELWQYKCIHNAFAPSLCPTCSVTVGWWERKCGDEIHVFVAGFETTGDCSDCAQFLSGMVSDWVLKHNTLIASELQRMHAEQPSIVHCLSQIKFAALSCYRWVQGAGPILNNPAGWHSEQCESMGCCKYDVTICIHPDGTIDSPTYTQSSQAQCTPDCYNGCSFDDGWEQIGKIGVDSKEENGASLSTFTLTPNPSSGKMRMTMLVPEKGDYSLSISDMQGVTVYEETINAKSASVEKDLTLDKLVSGVYLYKVNFENKTCFTGKITIIK